MKYLLKQNKEDKGILCDKVTREGFDYYVSDKANINSNNLWVVSKRTNYLGKTFYPKNDGTVTDDVIKNLLLSVNYEGHYTTTVGSGCDCDLVIATNNQNIDIPKVVDEVEKLSLQSNEFWRYGGDYDVFEIGFKAGYNKSQETHPFSLNDLKSLLDFITNEKTEYSIMYGNQEERFSTIDKDFTIDELINIWKEQQPKIVYYE